MIDGKKEIEEKKTFYFQWHFIESCNLRCTHCYQHGYDFKDLDNDKIFKIANILDYTLAKWKKFGRISLTGGEPFLRKDLLVQLLNFFESSDNIYWIGILTNGTLIDELILSRISKFKKLKEIQVSIDGADKRTHDAIRGVGNFDKVIKAVQLLSEKKFTISIMYTIHRQNKDDALRIIDLADQLKIDALTIERIVPTNTEDIKKFYIQPVELKEVYEGIYRKKKEVEKHSDLKIRVSRPLWVLADSELGGFCPAGFTSLSILHDGTVLPCRRLEIPLGNILNEGLFKIWYTSDVLWKLRNKSLLGSKCRKCEYLSKCGGCRAIAYKLTGDFMAVDPQCWKED